MNRRNFLKFCSFTFASLGTVSYIQNPVVSTSFNISEEEANPSNIRVKYKKTITDNHGPKF